MIVVNLATCEEETPEWSEPTPKEEWPRLHPDAEIASAKYKEIHDRLFEEEAERPRAEQSGKPSGECSDKDSAEDSEPITDLNVYCGRDPWKADGSFFKKFDAEYLNWLGQESIKGLPDYVAKERTTESLQKVATQMRRFNADWDQTLRVLKWFNRNHCNGRESNLVLKQMAMRVSHCHISAIEGDRWHRKNFGGRWAKNARREVPPFIWPGRIPQKEVTLVSGDSGVGKTFILCEIIAAITTGGAWPNGEGEAQKGICILITDEMDEAALRARLENAGANMDLAYLITNEDPDADKFSFPSCNEDFLQFVEHEVVRPAQRRYGRDLKLQLVAIEPVWSHLDAKVCLNNIQEGGVAYGELRKLASQLDAAIIATSHDAKATENAVTTAVGSVGQAAKCRSQLGVAIDPTEDDENIRLFHTSKSTHTAKSPTLRFRIDETGRVRWMGTSELTSQEILRLTKAKRAGAGKGENGERLTCQQWLGRFLANTNGKPVLLDVIKEAARQVNPPRGWSAQHLNSALAALSPGVDAKNLRKLVVTKSGRRLMFWVDDIKAWDRQWWVQYLEKIKAEDPETMEAIGCQDSEDGAEDD